MKRVSRTARPLLLAVLVAILPMSISPSRLIARAGAKNVWTEETQARARKLWEDAITAKGGRERLGRVKSLFVVADQGHGDRSSDFYLFPSHYFHYSYGAKREDTIIKVFNGNSNLVWWQPNTSPAQLRRLKSGDEDGSPVREAQFVLLLETTWLKPTPLRARTDLLGLRRVDVVETDVAGWRVDYYIDSKTHLPSRITYGSSSIERARGEMNHEVRLENYIEIGGVIQGRGWCHATSEIPGSASRTAG